jgi:glycosyltransferase involved in cell wall biosynthesis
MAMHCPKLSDLPQPPSGRTGWPWTEESQRLPNCTPGRDAWPRISVITPSFNQGAFIEETIRSVLLQGYPNVEYLILDGGSTDGSVEIIKKYSSWLRYWVTQPDAGQSDAINRGLKLATGRFATWINSDDLLCKNAIADHACRVGFDTNVVYIGSCVYVDENSRPLSLHQGKIFSLEDLVHVREIWRSGGQIVQPEVLFPLELARSVGDLNPNNHFTMDYEFWGKLLLAGAKFQYTEIQFGMFREHPEQKTHDPLRITESLLKTAGELIKIADSFSNEKKTELLTDLDSYNTEYRKAYWKGTGRLARIGLPRGLVMSLRSLKTALQKKLTALSRNRSSSYLLTRVR